MKTKHSHPGAATMTHGQGLPGLTDAQRQEQILDTLTEVKHWDLVPGSSGSQVPETPMEDEDREGRSESEQMAEEGVAAAERDQIHQAARVGDNGDRHHS